MVTLEHLKKYIIEHPHHFIKREKNLLEKAEMLASADGAQTIMSGQVEGLLGEHAEELFNLLCTNRDYLLISAKAVACFRK